MVQLPHIYAMCVSKGGPTIGCSGRFAARPAAGPERSASHMPSLRRLAQCASGVVCAALLAGCVSTAITLNPSPQAPVCERSATALVLWAPEWRPDQKDVAEREVAAEAGLNNFLGSSGCFAHSELRRIPDLGPTTVSAQATSAAGRFTRIVVIAVRELGPVVKLLSSAALVEGGTEVVLQVTAYSVPEVTQPREFTVHWRNGGPGVVKGVASLPGDMQAALLAGLQPGAAAR
jgi:hypothetical protein